LSRCSASRTALPTDDKWTFEIKFDGDRCIGMKRGKEVTLFSRNRNVLSKRFPRVVEAVASLGGDFVLDGELVAFDPQGRPSFQLLQNNLSRFIEKRPWSYISPLEGDSKDHHRAFLSEAAMITKTKVWRAAKLLACGRHSHARKKTPLWEASSPSAELLNGERRHTAFIIEVDGTAGKQTCPPRNTSDRKDEPE
jgi:ATP dependent DNA ligase domain